jgi:hypothetical protein
MTPVRQSATIDVVRGDDPGTLFRADGECELRTLSPLQFEKNIEFYAIMRCSPVPALAQRRRTSRARGKC